MGGGYKYKGLLGHGDMLENQPAKIIQALNGKDVVQVSAGWDHNLAVTRNGEVYSWGDAKHGKLGHGNLEPLNKPTKIEITNADGTPAKIFQASAGPVQSLFVTMEGRVLACGGGSNFELGSENTQDAMTPQPIPALEHVSIRYVAATHGGSFAVTGVPDADVYKDQPTVVKTETKSKDAKDNKDSKESKKGSHLLSPADVLASPDFKSLADLSSTDATTVATAENLALVLLAQLDRLTQDQSSKATVFAGTSGGDKTLLKGSCCIGVSRDNIGLLQRMLEKAAHIVANSKDKVKETHSYILLAVLRLLRANLHRLVISGVDAFALGIELPGQERTVKQVEKAKLQKMDDLLDGFDNPDTVKQWQQELDDEKDRKLREAQEARLKKAGMSVPTPPAKKATPAKKGSTGDSDSKDDTESKAESKAETKAEQPVHHKPHKVEEPLPGPDIKALREWVLNVIDENSHVPWMQKLSAEARAQLKSDAVEFVSVCLDIFYPTAVDKIALAKALIEHKDKRSQTLAPALLDRLCEDSVVASMIPLPLYRLKTKITVCDFAGTDLGFVELKEPAYVYNLVTEINEQFADHIGKSKWALVYGGEDLTAPRLSLRPEDHLWSSCSNCTPSC